MLRKTGLVTMRVDGTYRLYRADPDVLARLAGMLADFPSAPPDAGRTPPSEGTTP